MATSANISYNRFKAIIVLISVQVCSGAQVLHDFFIKTTGACHLFRACDPTL